MSPALAILEGASIVITALSAGAFAGWINDRIQSRRGYDLGGQR